LDRLFYCPAFSPESGAIKSPPQRKAWAGL